MNGYLIDTDTCIAFFKRSEAVAERFRSLHRADVHISEITLAELTYGAYKSARPEHHLQVILDFRSAVNVLPISAALDLFGKEKARLERAGIPIDGFDLLIGTTAIVHDLRLVTNNTRHFERLAGIRLENLVAKRLLRFVLESGPEPKAQDGWKSHEVAIGTACPTFALCATFSLAWP